LFGLSFFPACGRDAKVTPDGSVDPGIDASDGKLHTIQDVQNDANAVKTPVELRGVVVTAIDKFGTRNGEIWVEDPKGGPRSGIAVFGAPLTQVAGLAVGDLVDITSAVKSEFTIKSDSLSITELVAPTGGTMMVTKTGTGAVPAPAVVDALAIGMMATATERNAAWEQWEGVLVTVKDVAAGNAPSCIKSGGICTDVDSVPITGVLKVESALSGFPAVGIQPGDCFASVTGIVDYAFGYLIYQRTTDDIVTGGTQCPVENTSGGANVCTDGKDNDGDSFVDCNDFDCGVGPNAWLGTTCLVTDAMCGCSANLATASGVNLINTGKTGPVLLHDVLVTAVGDKGFWVADAIQATQNGGIFVFTNTAPDASIVSGAKVATLQGLAGTTGTGAQKLNQISRPTAGALAAATDPLPITGAATDTVSDIATGAAFAGSLVKLGPLKVTVVANDKNQIELTDNAGKKIIMDDGAFASYGLTDVTTIILNACFSSLTGVMDLQTTDQVRTINPRNVADMVAGVVGTGATDCK
jgi:hypothetical protein